MRICMVEVAHRDDRVKHRFRIFNKFPFLPSTRKKYISEMRNEVKCIALLRPDRRVYSTLDYIYHTAGCNKCGFDLTSKTGMTKVAFTPSCQPVP